jgi:hypothetical protein
MRIPSHFNEDNLYRRGSGRNDSAQTMRRVIRLAVALALVVVVMRQASKQVIYQPFFGQRATAPQFGPSPASEGDPSPASAVAQFGSGGAPTTEPVSIAAEDRTVANLLVQELVPTDQRQWVFALSRWQSGRSVAEIPSTVATINDRLAAMPNLSEQQRSGWQLMIASFMETTLSEQQSSLPATEQRPRVAALLAALDDAAAARVVDGSVWRSADFDSFYRYLDQAGDLSGAGVATVGVLPLLQQPDVFRNQAVRALGGVARAERIEAKPNPYGITEYWQLWLRPAGGADRPLVAIVPGVPEAVGAVGQQPISDQSPQVAIVGTYLKRLVYESAMGADLAPVVVGRIESAPLIERPVDQPIAAGNAFQVNFWLTAAVASLAGFGLAVIAIWRTSAMARRTRELRRAHRQEPDEFLSRLGTSAEPAPPTNQ